MKMNTILFLFPFLSSCLTQGIDSTLFLHPQEEKLIGIWQELGPKAPFFDVNGILVDSVDINAIFEFKDDFSFTCNNDIYLGSELGTWEFDSTYARIILYPTLPETNLISDHYWSLISLDSATLEVSHFYTITFPDNSFTTSPYRKFRKVQ